MVRFRGGAAALRRELHGHWMAMAMLLLLPLVTAASATSLPATPHAIQCDKTDTGLDYAYGDLRMIQTNTSAACCAACQAEPKCVLWVKDTTDTATRHDCFLKATYSDNPCSPTPTGKPCRRKLAGRQSMAPTGPAPPPLPPPPPPVLPPIPPQQHFLPVHDLSKKFRNWTYFTGGKYGGFVVPPLAGNFTGQTLTDTAVVFEKTPEDTLPGRWRMWYLYFNSIKGENGYQTALATSDDLLNWSFNHGGDNGIIFKRNDLVGSYDYGGVTMGCGLWNSSDLSSPRLLRDNKAAIKTGAGGRAGAAPAHKYYALYGCYPSRAGYESGDGGEGVAWSDDGVAWHRESETVPVVSGGKSKAAAKWESRTVYQPNLAILNGTIYDFYNAAGTNEYGAAAEESGLATLPLADLPGIDHTTNISLWKRDSRSPLIKSGPKGSCDSSMASDPKVFYDREQDVWVMFYFGVGAGTAGHADILVAFSKDLIHWDKDEYPLYRAGGHPDGIDAEHAHKISIIYDEQGVGYLYYTAVGPKGRGIALLTSKPVQ